MSCKGGAMCCMWEKMKMVKLLVKHVVMLRKLYSLPAQQIEIVGDLIVQVHYFNKVFASVCNPEASVSTYDVLNYAAETYPKVEKLRIVCCEMGVPLEIVDYFGKIN